MQYKKPATFVLGRSPYRAIPNMTSLNCVGAGARSLPTVGMLKRIYELGMEFNIIYGCSGGSMNAALFAQGDIDLLEHLWLTITNKDVRKLALLRMFSGRPGIYDFSPLHTTLKKYISPEKLAKCKSQIYVSVTSLSQYAGVYYDLKRLPSELHPADILLSSASIPVLVPPNMLLGDSTFDGGIFDNYSVSDAASRGVSKIYLLHPNIPEIDNSVDSIVEAVGVLIGIPMWSNYLHQKAALAMMPDPKPELVEIMPKGRTPGKLFDFNFDGVDRKAVIQLGYDLAKEKLG